MKSYQLYGIDEFPTLRLGGVDVTQNQLTLWGHQEEIQTRLKFFQKDVAGFEVWKVESKIPVRVFGIIKFWDSRENQIVERDFHEYLRPVEFYAYVHREDKFVMFRETKKVCRGVFEHIKKKSDTIALREKRVDFSLLRARTKKYSAAWFKKVSANIHAEGLTGDGVEDDPRFKELVAYAPLSSLTVKFKLFDADHRIQITRDAAVVLVQQYESEKTELELVLEFKRAILQNVWKDK